MGQILAREIHNVEARLVLDPTDISAAYPYGGTELAAWSNVQVRLITVRTVLEAEEWKSVPFETVGGSQRALVAGRLRQYDADAIGAIFDEYDSGTEVISRTATDRRGELGTARTGAGKLLVAAKDEDRHPSFLIPLAIPLEEDNVEINYEIDKEWQLPAIWMGVPDATGRAWQKGPLWRLTL